MIRDVYPGSVFFFQSRIQRPEKHWIPGPQHWKKQLALVKDCRCLPDFDMSLVPWIFFYDEKVQKVFSKLSGILFKFSTTVVGFPFLRFC